MAKKLRVQRDTLLLCAAIALYLFMMVSQSIVSDPTGGMQGILSQIQVLISIGMVMGLKKKGFIGLLAVNGLHAVQVGIYVLGTGEVMALPGIMVPLNTMLIAGLLYYYIHNLNQRVKVSMEQQEILTNNAAALNKLAYYDHLTGMLNRESIIRELNALCRTAKEKSCAFSLVFIDMDDFKDINDTMGHQAGDELLQVITERFARIKHPEDLLGRLGGDEFALVINRCLSGREIHRTLFAYKGALQKVKLHDGKVLDVSASFGVALAPQDASEAMDLIKYADTAMYKAKGKGKNRVQFFSHEMRETLDKKVEMERLMASALENRELHLLFQPQYDVANRGLRGFEALARWQSPVLGAVSPAEFIPLAEGSGLIARWGDWLMEDACSRFMQVMDRLPKGACLSVNLSPKQLMEPHFTKRVEKILHKTGMKADSLELEITESLFIADIGEALKVLMALKGFGIRLALDDFGTGYSSLYLLQQLPIDTLKIDKVCIDPIASDEKNRKVAASIIHLAHEMGIRVVAEGVENMEQLRFLQEQRCDYLQGYLWGRPMTLESWLMEAEGSGEKEHKGMSF